MHEVGQPQRLDQPLAVARHLDQRQLALDVRPLGGEVLDPLHRHQLGEQRLDLLDDELAAGGDDVDARQAAHLVDLRYRQALDIVAAAREQPDHPGEHAGLVVDERHDGVTPLFLARCHETLESRAVLRGRDLSPGRKCDKRVVRGGAAAAAPLLAMLCTTRLRTGTPILVANPGGMRAMATSP